jgi:hypothetical protein
MCHRFVFKLLKANSFKPSNHEEEPKVFHGEDSCGRRQVTVDVCEVQIVSPNGSDDALPHITRPVTLPKLFKILARVETSY